MSLFAFFGIWQTTLLAGAAAVAVPVIIHLLNRRRFKVVTWAAMQFLLKAQKQNTRRLRLEQLLLLLTRTALVALLVFAMASVMPWAESLWASVLPENFFGTTTRRLQRVHHVIVLDGSLSMNLQADGKPVFEQARQLAMRQVEAGEAGDGYSVLLLKDNPTWIVPEASQDKRKVLRELEAARPSHGNASLPAALNMVAGKLAEASQRFPAQAVYFVSDLQKATWQSGTAPVSAADADKEGPAKEKNALTDIQQRARVVFVDVGHDEPSNCAVTDLAFDMPFVTANVPVRVRAWVKNFGQEPRKNLRVELLAGKARETANDSPLAPRVVGQELVPTVEPGNSVAVDFLYRFPAPGTYAVQVRLDPDRLDLDDTRSVVVTVKETIPVLIVNGKAAADRYDRASEYLRLALNPYPAGEEPRYAPIRPRVINQAQFIDVTDAELAGYDAIYWADVGQFGTGDLRRIEAHLRRGGGLVVSLGDKAAENLDAYNRLLYKDEQGILPAKLLKKVQAPADHYYYFSAPEGDDAYKDWPLKAFADEQDRNALRHARFNQYVQAKVTAEGKVRTILSFMPETIATDKAKVDQTLPIGDPALVEWNPPLGKELQGAPVRNKDGTRVAQAPARYRGKVILFTSTVNMDWTTWPGSPSFGAMTQELARLAVSGRLREQASNVGSVLEEFLPGGVAELDAVVHYPAYLANAKPGRTRTQLVEDVNVFRWVETDFSGVYRVEIGGSGQEIPFAVNVPATTPDQRGSESDPERLKEPQLRQRYSGWDFQLVKDPRLADLSGGPVNVDIKPERVPVGPEFARYALLLVLALIFLEVLLAWRFGHYTSVDGAVAPPATGLFWPLTVAIFAAGVFGLGAYVMIDGLRTGDFLSNLGPIRPVIEGWLGVPPPPPGESNRWEPEMLSWLPAAFFPGSQNWWSLTILLLGAGVFVLTYLAEGPQVPRPYKLLLSGLRLGVLALTLWVLLPQFKVSFPRQGWPDLVILLDTSRSMGEPDYYQDPAVLERSKRLSEQIRKQVQERLPEKVKALEAALAAKQAQKEPDRDELDYLTGKLQYWQKQQEIINSEKWRPTRLQLAQALLAQPERDWLDHLLHDRQMKLHVYQLDVNGRAVKLHDDDGTTGEIVDPTDTRSLDRTRQAVAQLEAEGKESRLGTALRQVIDNYRGSSLAGVVMLTDGVTTRDEPIGQAAEYAAQKGVPLFFVGIGDDHEVRDLKLHDLQVEDTVYKGDRVIFECRLTGHGYKDLVVPVVLKVKEKDGKEKEVGREMVRVDPQGKSVKVRLRHQPMEVGRKLYIIEVVPPKVEGAEKPIPTGNLRLERHIEVIDNKLIKVLYVEQAPRYEFRYVKFLLEREGPEDKNKTKSIDLKVVLLDADDEFAAQDKSALSDFPATLEELNQYDVVILGDCDPNHPKLKNERLKNLANFVRGEDDKGRKQGKSGGGFLMIAGTQFAPHAYKDTPLADVLPVEPLSAKPPAEKGNLTERLRLELTPGGRMHPIFRFSPDEAENLSIWQRLAPIYWTASGYKLRPLAEVLAVHPTEKSLVPSPNNQDGRHPVVVQQFVGTGRSLFFGFDESWRWRLREDESKFNQFWIQTMRYLSRGRSSRTDLRLDRQTPYRLGEPVKVTVRFPDNVQGPDGGRINPDAEVKVVVEYRPGKEERGDAEFQTLQLAKVEGSWGTYEGTLNRTREGKYRFRLITPDVSKSQPDGEKPSADATVELPPGELDRLRMNHAELTQAGDATQGRFYNLVSADQVLEDIPPGFRVSLSSPMPPLLIWNHWLVFSLVMLLLTSEWLLRKRKHLL